MVVKGVGLTALATCIQASQMVAGLQEPRKALITP
jgi:hypothetical protein